MHGIMCVDRRQDPPTIHDGLYLRSLIEGLGSEPMPVSKWQATAAQPAEPIPQISAVQVDEPVNMKETGGGCC